MSLSQRAEGPMSDGGQKVHLEVTVYGSTELADGWLWWATVLVQRGDELKWVDSTGTGHSLLGTLQDAWEIVLREVALDPKTLTEEPQGA